MCLGARDATTITRGIDTLSLLLAAATGAIASANNYSRYRQGASNIAIDTLSLLLAPCSALLLKMFN